MNNFSKTNQLSKTVLRMSKAYSSFFYFTLEANENICFYSTLPFEKGQSFRDIVVYTTVELKENFICILNHCMNSKLHQNDIEILEHTIINDTFN